MNKYLKRTIIVVVIIVAIELFRWFVIPNKGVGRDGGSLYYSTPLYKISYIYQTAVYEGDIVNLDEFEDQNDVRSNCVYKDIKITWFPD